MMLRNRAMERIYVYQSVAFASSDGHDLLTVVSAEYDAGFTAGQASRDEEVNALNRIADYWYFRAMNPGAKTPEEKIVDSIIDGMEVNERREKIRAELDAVEAAMFDEARTLIAEGYQDIDIAAKVGLFLPVVVNLRAGVL